MKKKVAKKKLPKKTIKKKLPKKKVFTRSRSERYHGNLTSYRFVIRHKNAEFGVDDVELLQKFFDSSRKQLLKKIFVSPVTKKWRSIMRLTAAFKGTGTIESNKGESHDFPLWRATTDSLAGKDGEGMITTKPEFSEQFAITREGAETQIKDLFTENQNAYYEESSSQATTIKIDESLVYVETKPIKQHAVKSARKKRSGRKHSNIRHRDKSVDRRKKNSAVSGKKASADVRHGGRVSK